MGLCSEGGGGLVKPGEPGASVIMAGNRIETRRRAACRPTMRR
jgi:hypothetical protein